MRIRIWPVIGITTAIVVTSSLAGCGKGEMNPNAAPGVEAPGHGPSDGGSGNTPGETSGSYGSSGR